MHTELIEGFDLWLHLSVSFCDLSLPCFDKMFYLPAINTTEHAVAMVTEAFKPKSLRNFTVNVRRAKVSSVVLCTLLSKMSCVDRDLDSRRDHP